MKHLSRPYKFAGIILLAGAAGIVLCPVRLHAQAMRLVQLIEEPNPLLLHSSQGYLGVELADVDNEKAQSLKLKEVRGALITLIDHDAPAGQIGLKVNDVVLRLNGQPVEGAEQLRRMLREIPAGRKVSLEISRDGNIQTLAVELADRKIIEQNAWKRINDGGVFSSAVPGMGILGGGGDVPGGGSFHWWAMGSSLNVGAMVEPLTAQMADYLDLPNGLMVKSVAHKSAAAAAGLKQHDVILKVGNDSIATIADWERALHSNEGKSVQVTILRDRKQETLTLQVDSKHHSELQQEEIFPSCDGPQIAELENELAPQIAVEAKELAQQAQSLQGELGSDLFTITPQQADAIREQAEKLRSEIKPNAFKLDKNQMQMWQRTPIPHIIIDPSASGYSLEEQFDRMQRQEMEQLKRQMEELKALGFGDHI